MDKLLSAEDIEHIIGYPILILLYDDLAKVRRVEDILSENNNEACLVLVRSGENVGHWIILLKEGDVVTFFDSYGGFIDDQLGYSPIRYYPHMSRLLSEYDGEVQYNPYQLQRFGNKISTCGRWCAYYARNRDMHIDDFVKVMKKYKKNGIDLDKLVTVLTS